MRSIKNRRRTCALVSSLAVVIVCMVAGIVPSGRSQAADPMDPAVLRRVREILDTKVDPSTVKMAGPKDVRVGVVWSTKGNDVADGDKGVADGIVYVTNVSKEPVRIYVPAFDGPILSPPGAMPAVRKVEPKFGDGDFVILRPGETFGRNCKAGAGHQAYTSASYSFYEPGHEGDFKFYTGHLSSNGTYWENKK